jgi:hypothetical protein
MPVGVDVLYAHRVGVDRKSWYALNNLLYVIGRKSAACIQIVAVNLRAADATGNPCGRNASADRSSNCCTRENWQCGKALQIRWWDG